MSSPHHLFSQNLTLLPSPMEKTRLLFIKGHSFLISFQNPTSYPSSLTSRVHHPPSSTPYFLLITCFHRVPLSSLRLEAMLRRRFEFSFWLLFPTPSVGITILFEVEGFSSKSLTPMCLMGGRSSSLAASTSKEFGPLEGVGSGSFSKR